MPSSRQPRVARCSAADSCPVNHSHTRQHTRLQQAAAVLTARGRTAAATYRIRLKLSTADRTPDIPYSLRWAGTNVPLKAPFPWGPGPCTQRLVSWSHPSPYSKRHSIGSAVSACHGCDQQTDKTHLRPRHISNDRPCPCTEYLPAVR